MTRVFATFLILALAAAAEEPALPAGLGDAKPATEEPALPAGLGNDSSSSAGPALPPGLGGAAEEPALPSGLDTPAAPSEETAKPPAFSRLPLHGFLDLRGGLRLQEDPAQSKSGPLGEGRLQLETEHAWNRATLEITADFIGDGILEQADFDLRQARLTWTVTDRLDLRAGRQVLTWGTGDMLFINDLFPKDWQSFFSGRDVEYLKAPSDALKLGWYDDAVNIEFVYTPQFSHDRFITGERITYWQPLYGRFAGESMQVDYNAPQRLVLGRRIRGARLSPLRRL